MTRLSICISVSLCLTPLTLTLAAEKNACTGDPNQWTQIFDGKDLSGWKHVGPGNMTVEDSLIHTHGGMGLLYWTGGPIENCTLHLVFRMRHENDNRPERSEDKEDDTHSTGMLYSLTKPLATAWKPGPEWNTMDITLDGPRTIVTLNGVKVTDYKEGDPVPARKFDYEPQRGRRPILGYIGLQNHSDNDIVFFKEVAIKPLKK